MFSSNIWKFDNVERKIRFYQKMIAVDENHHQIASISLGCSTQTLSWGRIVDNKLWPGSIYGHHHIWASSGGRRLFHQERKKGGEKSTQITRAGPLSSGGEKERIVKTQIATLHLPAPVQKVPPSQSTGPPFNWSPI